MSTPAPYPPPWPTPITSTPSASPGTPLTSGFGVMAVVVQLALAVVIAISGWVAVLSVRGVLIVQRIQYGDYDAADEAQQLMRDLSVTPVIYVIAYVVAGALFITWLSQLRRSDRVAAEAMRYGPGWAIGGWLIPIVNFFRPYQVMTDVWRGMARPPVAHQASTQPPTPALVRWWWGAFLAAGIGSRVMSATLSTLPETLNTARTAFNTEIVVDVANIVAAVLAILVVRAFTAKAKATQPVWQVSAPSQPNAPWPQPYPAPSPYPAQPQYPAQPSHPQQSWNVQPSPTAPFSDQPSPWQRPIDAPPERPTGQADTTTGRIIGRRR